MRSNSMYSEMDAQISPISYLRLVYRTAITDRRIYQSKLRPLSMRRVVTSLLPTLKRPLFIVGAPRSGTTFLGSCLAELPEISYHFEPIATKFAARCVYEKRWGIGTSQWFYRTVYALLMGLHLDADLRFAEKTPRNCFLIDFLSQTFPQAQFIHIIRDGRDVALSYSKKPWLQAAQTGSRRTEPGGYRYGPYARFWVEPERVQEFESTSDLHRCIWAWRRFTESAVAAAQALSPQQYYELRYESLVSKPAVEAEKLLDFLQIESSDSHAKFSQNIKQAKTSSVGLWQNALTDDQRLALQVEAGTLLSTLGYLN